ncbi:hypothetical protein [Pusillimonas noertemannii]|uniref:Uncharacterized protein n=1 Tax=Pusillimonas noertemannii TaxID=305977 RepID=A0A2U1CMK0_9BURK|nr:hypothetical protein [Pusillimonas noertemannii]NYT68765.1 hypothetical protein [Pusillimonas noertemannii]PVY62213.1 hypothetical protein C7440_1706 [Pusillimonas noertemannii]TFL10807.1 hypothetical protein CSC72_09835 [Pusillimonas noertemannii]
MKTAIKTTNEIAAAYDSAPLMFKRESTRHPYSPNRRLKPSQEYRFEGKGGYAPNSDKIPLLPAIGYTAAFIGAGAFFMFVGAAAGF